MSFWTVPRSAGRVDALLLADDLVHGQQDRGGGVDRERGRDAVERDPVEDALHVGERVDRDADLADLARRERVVGVEAHLRRQVERDREAGLALVEQVAEALVGVLRASPAGVEPHRPEPAAVHARVDAAGERDTRRAGRCGRVLIDGTVERRVERRDRESPSRSPRPQPRPVSSCQRAIARSRSARASTIRRSSRDATAPVYRI